MSGKIKGAGGRNIGAPSGDLSLDYSGNEKILRECHQVYANDENGLVRLGKYLDMKLLAPRKKITVLLIGNHSAGKSAFINWYIEKHIQREGVAIETQGITIVTQGKRRETLSGNATLHLFPQFSALKEFDGVLPNLSTELCDSIAKRFPLVTFIDTPGLVDGSMAYAFDVNKVILWLANHADLVFVFFDPIGQALCKRTMTIVAQVGEKIDGEQLKFFLSKADESGDETDRQRVLMQITQEVCKWPSLNKTCFDIQTIYNPNRAKPTRCINQIEETAKIIDKSIQMTIQNTLNSLERDCQAISQETQKKLMLNERQGRANWKARFRYLLFLLLSLSLPFLLAFFLAEPLVVQLLGTSTKFHGHLRPVFDKFPQDYYPHGLGFLFLFSLFFFVLAQCCGRTKKVLTRKEKKRLSEIDSYVVQTVEQKRQELYKNYLKLSVKDSDFSA